MKRRLILLIATLALLASACGIHGGSTFSYNGCQASWWHEQTDSYNGNAVADGEGAWTHGLLIWGNNTQNCGHARVCVSSTSPTTGNSTDCTDWVLPSDGNRNVWYPGGATADLTAVDAWLDIYHNSGTPVYEGDSCWGHPNDNSSPTCPNGIPVPEAAAVVAKMALRIAIPGLP